MIVVLFILLASVIVSIVAFIAYKKQKFDSIAQPLIL